MIIYQVTNRIDGRVYIGQTNSSAEKRWAEHQANARSGIRTYLYDSIRKYGCDNFVCEAVCEVPAEWADFAEMLFIAACKSFPPALGFGYNLTAGGRNGVGFGSEHPNFGKKFSAEYRAKLSASQMGHVVTDVTKGKISRAKKGKPGKPHSLETRKKIATNGFHQGMLGKQHSHETREKMRLAQQARWQRN